MSKKKTTKKETTEKKRTIKSVAFSLTDEVEIDLLKHAEKEFDGERRNFNEYVLMLIQADLASEEGKDSPIIIEVKSENKVYALEV